MQNTVGLPFEILDGTLVPGVILANVLAMAAFGVLGYHTSWTTRKLEVCALPAGVNVVRAATCVSVWYGHGTAMCVSVCWRTRVCA